MTDQSCHYRPGDTRALDGHHLDDCHDEACPGCQPCTAAHCVLCGIEHATAAHPLTDAGCVGAMRLDLAAIVELTSHLRDQAANGASAGRLIAAAPIPGGDAMVLIGPAANGGAYVRQWMHRQYGTLDANGKWVKLDISHLEDEYANDPEPPLLVLANLEEIWRDTLGMPKAQGRATMRGVVAYLSGNLTWAAQKPEIDIVDFAATLRRLRGRLEDTLTDGYRPEKTKTPCLDCGAILVVKYGRKAADDHRACPACGRRYSHGEFTRAQAQHLASEDAERFVKLLDGIRAIPRPEWTVRAWVRRGEVIAYCDVRTHQVWVWWPDLRRLHREREIRDMRVA